MLVQSCRLAARRTFSRLFWKSQALSTGLPAIPSKWANVSEYDTLGVLVFIAGL